MQYFKRLFIIILISMAGELLNYLIPLPVPASIYGFLILFVLLVTKVVKVDYIRPVTDFLLNIMPVTFIAPGVALITMAEDLEQMALPIAVTVTMSTIVVMGVVAKVVEMILDKDKNKEKREKI